jgi:hypothetical protein
MFIPRDLRGPIRDASCSDPREHDRPNAQHGLDPRDGCAGISWGHDFLRTITVSNFRLDTRRGFRHFASVGFA